MRRRLRPWGYNERGVKDIGAGASALGIDAIQVMISRMIVKLVRHGESQLNAAEIAHGELPDHRIPLTAQGFEQARRAGRVIGDEFVKGEVIYSSP